MPFDSHNNRLFQSTLSVRRATDVVVIKSMRFPISIHALRKESDDGRWLRTSTSDHFNPRSP